MACRKVPTIFDEPPPNVDETWTHGAMLGGTFGYDDQDLADSYFLAGDMLVTAALANRATEAREIIGPVLYVYRHGIELYLKLIVRPSKRNHELAVLLGRFCRHVRIRYKQDVPAWLRKPVSEFIQYDPSATVFRYATDKKGRFKRGRLDANEVWVDLPTLQTTMRQLRHALRRVIIADKTGRIPPHIEVG